MDPNANLAEQETLLTTLRANKRTTARNNAARSRRLTELQEALTAWLRNGGCEPDWSKCPNAARYYRRESISSVQARTDLDARAAEIHARRMTENIRARHGRKCRKCGGYNCPETGGDYCRWMQQRDRE